jgi:hypothetical protein
VTSVNSPGWNDDEELLRELRIALREEPVADDIVRAAREAFTWRLDDAEIELLTLTADGDLEVSLGPGAGAGTGAAAQVRGGGDGPQTLVFHGAGMSVEVEIDETGIVGQLIPPQPGRVTLVTAEGRQATTQADEVGCFSLPRPGPGPLRLDCQLADFRFVTEWTTT